MHVGAIGSGDLLRILEATLKLPNPSGAPHHVSAAAAPAREDEAVLRYAPISQLVQVLENRSVAAPPAVSQNDISVQQIANAIAEFAKLDPGMAAAVAIHLAHESGHAAVVNFNSPSAAGYASYTGGAALAQASLAASVYAPAFSQAPDYTRRTDFIPVRAVSDAAGRRRWRGLGPAAWDGTRRLWVRAPLLVLLLSWLVAGLCAGMAAMLFAASAAPVNAVFDLWAIGFLSIVCFGFYARVRSIRLPRRQLK